MCLIKVSSMSKITTLPGVTYCKREETVERLNVASCGMQCWVHCWAKGMVSSMMGMDRTCCCLCCLQMGVVG